MRRREAAMRERMRNPRRVVKDVKRRCHQYDGIIVSTWRSILSCGHEVEGYPDTLDGRKACPECGREERNRRVACT